MRLSMFRRTAACERSLIPEPSTAPLELQNPIMAKRRTVSMKSSAAEAAAKAKRKKQSAVQSGARRSMAKPSVLEKGYERSLVRVATKGVVALFNAISQHQRGRSEEGGDAGDAADGKDTFLALLRQQQGEADPAPKRSAKGSKWGVLDDEYMMGAGQGQWGADAVDGAASEEEEWNAADALAAAMDA